MLRPIIPRRLQIQLRRRVVLYKRQQCSDKWPVDEKAGQPPQGWPGWPEGARFALVLTHDVETAAGQEKCYELMNLEQEFGVRSSFNFVPERYAVSEALRNELLDDGFEVAVHGLKHDGKLYNSSRIFQRRAIGINHYLEEWQAVGFRSPAMHHNLDWIHDLAIEYDASTFDTDPFEPQPDGVGTVFPFWVQGKSSQTGYVELPYTLPHDFTLFILMQEQNIDIWKKKIDWIVRKGGMALVITHPDYMNFASGRWGLEQYPAALYRRFLEYVMTKYEGLCWHALPMTVAKYFGETFMQNAPSHRQIGTPEMC